MGKRTNPVSRIDTTDTETPLDLHKPQTGIDVPFEDTADLPTAAIKTMVPTTEESALTAAEATNEIPARDDLPATRESKNTAFTEPTDSYAAPDDDADVTLPSTDLTYVTTDKDADIIDMPEAAEPSEETEESPDVQAARARIEQTRAEMSETIDAIKEKLSPQHVLQEAKDTMRTKAEQMAHTAVETAKDVMNQAKDKAQEVAPKVVQTVKRNPIPFLAGGLVFGWLILRSLSRRRNYCD